MTISQEHLDALRDASTCAVSDALDQLSRKQWVMAPPLQLVLGQRIFGTAVTLLVAVTGEKAHHKVGATVIDESPPGTVIVAAGEPDACALFGELEIEVAASRGLGGLVTDCAIRMRAPADHRMGVAASGRSAAGGFGRVKTMARDPKLSCGGVQVSTGDLVIGDANGIVVVPVALVPEVARLAGACEARLDRLVQAAREERSVSHAVQRHWELT